MKENTDNKNITSFERRILKFFFALTDREKNARELVDALGVSLSTVQRYANIFEMSGIARIKRGNGKAHRGGKIVGLRPNTYFLTIRIKENRVDILLISFLPKYEYSVILPYNESLSDADNALYIKRILNKLCAKVRAEKTFVGIVLSDDACICESICRETICNTELFTLEGKIWADDNKQAQNITTEEVISALVIETIRKIRAKTAN